MARTKYKAKEIHRLLAHRVLTLRTERGWTQEVLAELTGLHKNYIGSVERAQINMGLENILKIAAAFDLSIGELLTFPVNQYGKNLHALEEHHGNMKILYVNQ
jgi:transcriptional regulator with XRE-family HTH domain